MKNNSIWKSDIGIKECPKINKDTDVDVLIVGGGITGISCLYHLRQTKLKTILVERNICGMGVTCKSTAKITYLQENVYANIRKFINEESASLYLKSQRDASKLLVDIIKKEKIACDLENSPSYLFVNDKKYIKKLDKEFNFLRNNGVIVDKVTSVYAQEKIIEAIKVNDTYTFHPLKFINHLKEKYKDSIYEHSKLENIKRIDNYYQAQVNGYKIKAKYIIIATHYPYFAIPFLLPLKSSIETSYIGAKEFDSKESFNAINLDNPCISLRTVKNKYLVYLYQSFKSCNIKNVKDNFDILRVKGNFVYIWSNKDIITNDYLPFIGRIKANDDTLLFACGYNTWGMTNGTLAGKILSDIILKKNNPYIELFSPHRVLNVGKIINFPIDVGCSAKAIIKSTKGNVNNSKVIYTKKDGKSVAIYKDANGIEHIVLNKCPHMKCGLILNEVEQTWDCYCHGSRFDIDGNVIEGPSNFDIRFKSE